MESDESSVSNKDLEGKSTRFDNPNRQEGTSSDNNGTRSRANTRNKRNRDDRKKPDKVVTAQVEPYFRAILKKERLLEKQKKHLETISSFIDDDLVAKGLQISIKPATHTQLSLDKQLKWQTTITNASMLLQKILQEHWEEKITQTRDEILELTGLMNQITTEEKVQQVEKKIQEILRLERQDQDEKRPRTGDSEENQ